MEPLNNIQSQLRAYVDGRIDYASFRPRIAEGYFDHIASGDQASQALRLCRAIEWEIADYSEGLISEELLKHSLESLLDKGEAQTKIPSVKIVRVMAMGSAASMPLNDSGSNGTFLLPGASGSLVPESGLIEQPV